MAIITAKDLSFAYDGRTVLEDVNFALSAGDYLCVVGENGSGKSTLVKGLLGLKAPDGGSIVFGEGLKPTEIGYLPQQTQVQRDFPASVREIVLSGCQARNGLRPFYSKEDKALAVKNMERMEIADFAERCYRDLSGGQQQRVLLARALCAAEKVLLLDEPVTGLDPVVTADMYGLIRSLNKEGVTILMISHDIEAALRYATHILHVGEPLFFGTKDQYLGSEIGRLFAAREGRPHHE